MPPGRIYRDYSTDDPPFRTPSIKRDEEKPLPSSPRTVISIARHDNESYDPTSSSEDEYYGAGIAHTTNGHRAVPHWQDTSAVEPVLHQDQLGSAHDSAAPSVQRQRSPLPTAPSFGSQDVSRASSDRVATSIASRMPEFFSQTVFHSVLHNPTIAHQLLKFAQTRLCGENLEFLARVDKYYHLLDEVSKSIHGIHTEFLSQDAPSQINLEQRQLQKVQSQLKASLSSNLPALESIFVDAQSEIEKLVYHDIYPKFVRRQMSISAARALGTDRTKYGGLGDCFVLTDPRKADNPIVFASEGFVKVTGYTRNEIIPRNCRFLNSQHTDRSAVKRLSTAIYKREESVELLLNHRKNGEPFWNLLYVAPLFDDRGSLVFYLGGQIDCSTAVHSASDVLRILAQSEDTQEELPSRGHAAPPVQPLAKTSRRSLFSAFRTPSKSQVSLRPAGMEHTLMEEDQPLDSQVRKFYTAYSNVRPNLPFHLPRY